MRRIPTSALVLAVVALASACASQGMSKEDRINWTLSAVEIDEANIAKAGSMPVFRRTDGQSFGQTPHAVGSLRMSDDGLVACNVRFQESVMGLTGTRTLQEYDIVNLVGKSMDNGRRVDGHVGGTREVPLGTVTDLVIERISSKQIRVRPMSRDIALPYTFVFEPASMQHPVTVPLVS